MLVSPFQKVAVALASIAIMANIHPFIWERTMANPAVLGSSNIAQVVGPHVLQGGGVACHGAM